MVGAQYIYYYLQHFNLNRLIFGSGQPLITGGMLKKVKVSLGNIQEQNKLTRLLSLLDERIATQNKVIDKLQSLIKGISNKLLNSKEGMPVRLGAVLKERSEKTKVNNQYTVLSSTVNGLFHSEIISQKILQAKTT